MPNQALRFYSGDKAVDSKTDELSEYSFSANVSRMDNTTNFIIWKARQQGRLQDEPGKNEIESWVDKLKDTDIAKQILMDYPHSCINIRTFGMADEDESYIVDIIPTNQELMKTKKYNSFLKKLNPAFLK